MISRFLVIGLICAATFGAKPSFAAPDEYDDSQSNPFRIAAYLMYPVGWLAEWIVFRPFHFMVSATEPQEAFFGHRPHPPRGIRLEFSDKQSSGRSDRGADDIGHVVSP